MNSNLIFKLVIFTLILKLCHANYKIGVGRADVTGPSVEIAFVSFF